jgi:hypothetical protein
MKMKKSHFPKAKLAFSPLRMNREHKKVSVRGLGWPSCWGSEEPGNGRLDNAQSKRPPGSSLLPRWRAHLDRRLVSKYPKQSGGCVSFLLISGSSVTVYGALASVSITLGAGNRDGWYRDRPHLGKRTEQWTKEHL